MADLTNKYIYETYPSIVGIGEQGSSGVTGSLKPLTDGVGEHLPIEVSRTEVDITADTTTTKNLTIAGYGQVIDNNGNWVGPGSATTSGTSGSSGTDGTSGTNGVAGTSGTDGSSGSSGLNGAAGTSGTDGSSGSSGTDGSSGSSGLNGVAGTSGTDGSSGSSGTSGSNGISSGRVYYFNESQASGIEGYKSLSDTPSGAGLQTVTVNLTSGQQDALVSQFITPELGFTIIPSGVQRFKLYFNNLATNADVDTYVTLQLANSAGVPYPGIITSGDVNIAYNAGTPLEVDVDVVFSQTTILATDRMIVKIYLDNQDSTSRTVEWNTENGYYSYVITSVAAASGTSGTDGTSGTNGTSGVSPAGAITSSGPNTITEVWSGSQAQYDALGSYSATTLYFID